MILQACEIWYPVVNNIGVLWEDDDDGVDNDESDDNFDDVDYNDDDVDDNNDEVDEHIKAVAIIRYKSRNL
jgi:hypothetical protein